MSNPQLENGYCKIANEILDALARIPLGNSNAQIVYAIIRKTYGWNKTNDDVSISQLVNMTGCSKRTVIYALQNLEAKRIIIIERKRGRGNINLPNNIRFNKKYKEWVVQEKSKQYDKVLNSRKKLYRKNKEGVVQEEKTARGVVQETEKRGVFLAHTKDTTTKDNTNNIVGPSRTDSGDREKLDKKAMGKAEKEAMEKYKKSSLFLKGIVESKKNIAITPQQITAWTKSFRLLCEVNKVSLERIRDALVWYKKNIDDEHCPVIFSGKTFREKFLNVENQMKRHAAKEKKCEDCDYKRRGDCDKDKVCGSWMEALV